MLCDKINIYIAILQKIPQYLKRRLSSANASAYTENMTVVLLLENKLRIEMYILFSYFDARK